MGGHRAQRRAGVHAGACQLDVARRAADVLRAGNRQRGGGDPLRGTCRSSVRCCGGSPAAYSAVWRCYRNIPASSSSSACSSIILSVPKRPAPAATPGPWLAVVVALPIFSPVLVWNPQHSDVGFSFQNATAAAGANIHPLWLARVPRRSGGLSVSAALRALRDGALARAWPGRRDPRGWLIALIKATGPLVLFNVVSLWAHSQPHWPMPGWVFTIVLFGRDAAALAAAGHASPAATWRGRRQSSARSWPG